MGTRKRARQDVAAHSDQDILLDEGAEAVAPGSGLEGANAPTGVCEVAKRGPRRPAGRCRAGDSDFYVTRRLM